MDHATFHSTDSVVSITGGGSGIHQPEVLVAHLSAVLTSADVRAVVEDGWTVAYAAAASPTTTAATTVVVPNAT
jgi:hypothetical protein